MRSVRRSLALAAAAVLVLAGPSGATGARPDSGGRDIQSFALANFSHWIDDCTTINLAVSFVAGDNLQSPIGSGKPGSWSDVELRLEAVSTCEEADFLEAWWGQAANLPPTIDPFVSASLDAVPVALGSETEDPVDAVVDLTWTGIGDPTVTTHNEDGYIRAERSADASVEGSVELGPGYRWGEGLVFVPADAGEARIGWAAEISTLAPPSCAPAPDGLTNWWTGEGVVDRVDGVRGALIGDAHIGPGLVRTAFQLAGDGDYVEMLDASAVDIGSGDFSIALWVRFTDTSGEQVLAEKWLQKDADPDPSLGWTLTKLEDDSLLLAVSGPDAWEAGVQTEPRTIEAGRWYHVAARRAGSETTLFVDGLPWAWGELDSSVQWDLSSPLPLSFGHRADERGLFLNGAIDEVMVFVGTAIPDEAVWQIYAAGAAGICRNA